MGDPKRVPLDEIGDQGVPSGGEETPEEKATRMAELDKRVRAVQVAEAGKLDRIAGELQDPARQASAEKAVERNLSDIEVVRARFDLVRKEAEARRQAQARLQTDKATEQKLRKKRAESREAYKKITENKSAATEEDLKAWQASGYISPKIATSLIQAKKLLAEIQSFAKDNPMMPSKF